MEACRQGNKRESADADGGRLLAGEFAVAGAEAAAGAGEGHLDGWCRCTQHACDLGRVQPVEFAQQQGGALTHRQAAQRGLYQAGKLVLLVGIAGRRRQFLVELQGCPAATVAPQLVATGVIGDAVSPGASAGRLLSGALQEELEQHLLGDVLGVLVVAQQTQGEVVDAAGLPAMESGKDGGLSRDRAGRVTVVCQGTSRRWPASAPALPDMTLERRKA